MLNSAALPRISLPTADMLEMLGIIEEDAAKIGYSHGNMTVVQGRFLMALAKCDLMPFDRGAVIQYKNKVRRQHNAFKMPWQRAQWWNTRIASYAAPIPTDVLRKAAQLQSAVLEDDKLLRTLGSFLRVEYFAKRPKEYTMDPFLVAEIGDEVYYLAVWDEPTFKP